MGDGVLHVVEVEVLYEGEEEKKMKKEQWNKMTKEEKSNWMLEEGIDILAKVFRAPFHVIQDVANNKYEFVVGKSPKEVLSDEEPPTTIEERAEIIPIDEYLGLYEPNRIKITVFNKGIENASTIIKCNPKHLRCIVRLHEWSHALIHIALSKDDGLRALKEESYWEECLEQSNQIYGSMETKLHEHLAQLLTYHSLNLICDKSEHPEAKEFVGHVIKTFQELNKRQPSEYKINDHFKIPRDRIIRSIDLLKKGWLKGVFDAWRTVVML